MAPLRAYPYLRIAFLLTHRGPSGLTDYQPCLTTAEKLSGEAHRFSAESYPITKPQNASHNMKKEEFLALMSAAAHDLAEFVIAQHPELFEDEAKTSAPTPSPEGATYPSVGCQPYENNVHNTPEPCRGDITTEARAAADEEPPQVAPRQRRARFPFTGW